MGSTVCGIGYSDGHTISDFLEFDFDGAKSDSRVSFNYFSANTSMGQTSVPGWDTPDMCNDVIAASKTAHILEHPINARAYGYAAYDYGGGRCLTAPTLTIRDGMPDGMTAIGVIG